MTKLAKSEAVGAQTLDQYDQMIWIDPTAHFQQNGNISGSWQNLTLQCENECRCFSVTDLCILLVSCSSLFRNTGGKEMHFQRQKHEVTVY